MDIKQALRNPLVAFADWKKRRELKLALLNLMSRRAAGVENGIQFEGITLDNPTMEAMPIVLVLREIVAEDRQFSIVQWPGGIALVRTAGVDNLGKELQQVNETSNYIIRGGSEKAINLFDHAAKPTGPSKKE